jgi:hypothetical protein
MDPKVSTATGSVSLDRALISLAPQSWNERGTS